MTADRLLAFVYDELSEPRSFQAPPVSSAGARAPQPHAFAGAACQALDPFSAALFATAGAPAGLFALRHNREFPLKRLVALKEVRAAGRRQSPPPSNSWGPY